MDSDPTNADRAGWARKAVNAFAKETFGGRTFTATVKEQPNVGDDAYCMIQDLITDCMHLARKHGWKPDQLIDRAVGNFVEEEAEEQQDAQDA